MREEITLRIVGLADGRWKFDVKAGMNDDEIWRLIERMKYVENKLRELMETDLIKATETIEILRHKK